MSYLMIENEGEIEIAALSLMGASTKRADNSKIGMFGSGNKYAMAVLLRYNVGIVLFSGEDQIKICTKTVDFRGNIFDNIFFITEDGKEHATSMTVQAGPDWKLWFAIRELYCNALDEGKEVIIPEMDSIYGKKGKTRFYIERTDAIMEILSDWEHYFSLDRTDAICSTKNIKIFPAYNNTVQIYRKGILVHESWENALFHYELNNTEINESRVLKEYHTTLQQIGELAVDNMEPDHIRLMLEGINAFCRSQKECMEMDFDIRKYATSFLTNKEAWEEVIEGKIFLNYAISGKYQDLYDNPKTVVIPYQWALALSENFKTAKVVGVYTVSDIQAIMEWVEMSDERIKKLNLIKAFMSKVGYQVEVVATQIRIARFTHHSIFSQNTYIAEKYFAISVSFFDVVEPVEIYAELIRYFMYLRGFPLDSTQMQTAIMLELIAQYEKVYF